MSKLFYTVESGTADTDQLKQFLEAGGCKVRKLSPYADQMYGSIVFQKKDHRDAALQRHKQIEIGGATIILTEGDPRSEQPCSQSATPQTGSQSQSGERVQIESFYNPYHFVDAQGFTPRYGFSAHDRFTGHSGRLSVEIECTTPLFIPDPGQTRYIISDQTLLDEDDNDTAFTVINDTIDAFIRKNKLTLVKPPLDVLFDPECRKWDRHYPNNHLLAWKADYDKNPPQESSHWARGEICKAADGAWQIRTDDPDARRYAHKEMDFFRVNGQPVIPGSSVRGAVRNRLEVLSNACFCGYDKLENDVSYMFRRLDILQRDQRQEATNLKPVILHKTAKGWRYVKVHQARVLSDHLFNRIGRDGITGLGAYYNTSEACYEKISIVGSNEYNRETGLNAYHRRKTRGRIVPVGHTSNLTKGNFQITSINNTPLTQPRNIHNSTFAYTEIEDRYKNPLYGIIRRLGMERGDPLFKIKVVSANFDALNNKLEGFQKSETDPNVQYAISQIRIKTSFDIDTKTQHRAFFVFGARDLNTAVAEASKENLTTNEIDQFTSLLQQRKQNAAKLPADPEGINKRLAQELPERPYNGMLAYFSPQGGGYLTYTTVPQKPYKYSIRSILQQQDKKKAGDTLGKLACNKLNQLCPACQLFGTVNLDERLPGPSNEKAPRLTALKGKLAFGNATPANKAIPSKLRPMTLKPLGTPKQTYYPFYLLNNRVQGPVRDKASAGFNNYDDPDMRVGRKVYLHHQPGKLDYQASTRTNLNATIQPVPAGSRFQFTIHFTNLSTYELGLLLYSLNMRYRGEKTGFQLGMGKPLGLGSCRLHLKEVQLLNLEEHYRSFLPAGEQILTPAEIEVLEQKYQYVQGAPKQVDFNTLRQNMDNHRKLPALQSLTPSAQDIEQAWLSKPYIHEYHFLSSLNVHSQLALNAPLVFAADQKEGFKWYQKARKNPKQALFVPKDLENNFDQQARFQLKKET